MESEINLREKITVLEATVNHQNQMLKVDGIEIRIRENIISRQQKELSILHNKNEELCKLLRDRDLENAHIKLELQSKDKLQFKLSQNGNDVRRKKVLPSTAVEPTDTAVTGVKEKEHIDHKSKLEICDQIAYDCKRLVTMVLSCLGKKMYMQLCDMVMKWKVKIPFIGTNSMQHDHSQEGTIVERQSWIELLITYIKQHFNI